ncbi:GNAT family N-acetyltransferase [Gloeothece verrucosa]|uniref:GCN5-related N-acetyltransferase n=1 Tax=Gloeothece verrucosa (strain PCC 7822) TaxID=497965 RepID=E0UGB7_GLOV7|nr:GNAT family N-acetyltransferase [Gloeothece verrucosa]ADN16736.1 GCN5-related N-acetyltransferase [Gloeothece verrucosa PCC 7822]
MKQDYQQKVVTKRLDLIPFKLELVQAAIGGNDQLGKVLGVRVLPDWLEEDNYQILPEIAAILTKYSWQGEWGWGNLVIHQADNTLIGHVMLKIIPDATGSPTESLELGYIIAPSYRRQGYGTEATKAMLDWSLSQPNMQTVTAGCYADNIASKRVLEKIGMRHIDTRGNGKMLVWELNKTDL